MSAMSFDFFEKGISGSNARDFIISESDRHLNEKGAELIADVLFDKLKQHDDGFNNIKKVLRLKNQNHIQVVKKLGKACSYPGTFMGSIHAIITSTSYKSAIIKTIKAGGCNCSRANFTGAYFAALKGVKSIPLQWIKKTKASKEIISHKKNLINI